MKYPNRYEIKSPFPTLFRTFQIPFKKFWLNVVACVEPNGWGHVSVTLTNNSRIPKWEEMCFIKDIFFDPEELCIQFHPKKSQYVNLHDKCLHIWQPPKEIANLLELQG